MQFGEERYEDETFYFDDEGHGELIVPEENLPETYPQVTELEGRSVIATFVSGSGEMGTYSQNSDVRLCPGSRVERVQTGGETSFRWNDEEVLVYSFEEKATGIYVPAKGDVFILKPNTFDDETEMRVHPATEPLPELEGSWTVEAAITADNRLVTWGETGHQQLVDWCIALQLMETTPDYVNLNRSSARSISILGMFSVNRVVQKYFAELEDRTGADFTPKEEFVAKMERVEIDPTISDELWPRYYPES